MIEKKGFGRRPAHERPQGNDPRFEQHDVSEGGMRSIRAFTSFLPYSQDATLQELITHYRDLTENMGHADALVDQVGRARDAVNAHLVAHYGSEAALKAGELE